MIIFFFRRYNDIDHITPIIYRMFMDGHENIEVLCLNPKLDINNDFRCLFLKDKCNLTVRLVYDAYHPTRFHKIIASFIKWSEFKSTYNSNKATIISKINYILRAISNRFFYPFFFNKYVSKKVFSNDWATKMLREKKPSKLVFDRHNTSKRYPSCALVTAAKNLNIPLIAVPHGLALSTNDDWTNEAYKTNGLNNFREILKDFDAYLVPFSLYKQKVVRGGADSSKLHVLGSSRFCKEWRELLFNIIPKSNKFQTDSGKSLLKVVLMDHSPTFRINGEVIFNTIKKLVALKNVEVIVKPSTASQESKKSGISSVDLIKIAKVDYDSNSIELIRWADVVIGTTSSILLEPLFMGTTFIYPKYFHENTMLWEDMNACWTVNNYDELEVAMNKIIKSKKYKPYSDANVDKFLEEVVYGGDINRDVLGDYSKFISSFSKK
jgi:hypothetical protein